MAIVKRALLMAAVLVGFAPAMAADGAQSPADLIKQYEAEARALTEQGGSARVVEQIGTLRAWLGEARAYLASDEPERLQRRLELSRAQIRLIRANLERAQVEAAVRSTRDQAEATEKVATDLRNEAFRLEQRLTELEQKAGPSGAAPAPTPAATPAATPTPAPAPGGTP